jgi:hypothetical protein
MAKFSYSAYFEPARQEIVKQRGAFTCGDLYDFESSVNAFKPIYDEREFGQLMNKMARCH